MIKFFRKIRQQLLSQNKFRNYLLYAIGEIVLVMIGILLALQVNNWNQERLELKKFNSNLLYILEDIEQNQIQLNELKSIRGKALDACTVIIDKFRQSRVITTEVWNEAFFEVVIERLFRGNYNGFEKAKSSVIYESEMFAKARQLVMEYDETIEQLNYAESKLNVTIEEIERELFKNGFQNEVWDFVRIDFIESKKYKKPDVKLNFLELINDYPEVKGIFLRYEVDAPIFLRLYDSVLNKGKELKNELKKHLRTS